MGWSNPNPNPTTTDVEELNDEIEFEYNDGDRATNDGNDDDNGETADRSDDEIQNDGNGDDLNDLRFAHLMDIGDGESRKPDYELARDQKIARNNAVLKKLGFFLRGNAAPDPNPKVKQARKMCSRRHNVLKDVFEETDDAEITKLLYLGEVRSKGCVKEVKNVVAVFQKPDSFSETR